jgi:hypothetical protein
MTMHPPVAAALAVGAVITLMPDTALACRGGVVWSTGADVSALRPGEIAIRAKLLASYRGEQRFGTIMGHEYGMVYLVEVAEVIGASAGEGARDLKGKSILVHSGASPCEQYRPRKFAIDDQKIFVLRGASGFYQLTGGQE